MYRNRYERWAGVSAEDARDFADALRDQVSRKARLDILNYLDWRGLNVLCAVLRVNAAHTRDQCQSRIIHKLELGG